MDEPAPKAQKNFKLVHSVSELGLGARIALTRRRLIFVTGITLALFIGYALVTTGFMRAESRSVGLNMILISLAILFMIVAGFAEAILIGDLTFPGTWRERVILGRKVELSETEELEASIGKLKDSSLVFYAVLLGCIILNFSIYELTTGGFFSEYQDWGYNQTLLRAESPDSRTRGLRNLTNPKNYGVGEIDSIRAAVVGLVSDPNEEVRDTALWAISELRIFEAAPSLITWLQDDSGTDAFRARAAEALGSLSDDQGIEVMLSLLDWGDLAGRETLAIGLLRGLGLSKARAAVAAVEPFLDGGPYELNAHAHWVLSQCGGESLVDGLFERVDQGSPEQRCMAAEALKFLVEEEDDAMRAIRLFQEVDGVACTEVAWVQPHWDSERRSRIYMVSDESLHAKLLKIIFVADGPENRDFFAIVANDAERLGPLRSLARELVDRIENRY